MEGIPQEEINYFKSLERKFWDKYDKMTEKENFNIWVLENAKDWLKIGEFTRKNEEDKRNFTKFVEMKPDDDTTDPSYIYRVTNLAMDYVKYMKSKKKRK